MADIHERFEVAAPVETVYAALAQPERIVGSLPGVSSMYRYGDDRYRVDIAGPAHAEQLQLAVTERVPARRVAWQAVDGRWRGSVDLESLSPDRTLVIVIINDAVGASQHALSDDDARVIEAAMRMLKHALEQSPAADAGAGDADHIRVEQGVDDAERDVQPDSTRIGDELWRGSRTLLRGGEQAFGMMRSISREMDKLWDQVMRRAAQAGRGAGAIIGGWSPCMEIYEHDGEVCVSLDVPGVAAEDLHVEAASGMLVVRGERRSRAPAAAQPRTERIYGAFVRRMPLPEGLRTDAAVARLSNGVLEVRIPVLALREAREIPIETQDAERPA